MSSSAARILSTLPALAVSALAAGNNWMTPLNGAQPLSRLSIPGTHDSGALHEPVPGTAKCQNLTIARQLDAGVRFLDIRCRHVNDSFAIHHGHVYQKLNFTDVLDATCGFLDSNPGETVIMSVKEEYKPSGNTRSFEATFGSHVALNPAKWLTGSTIPTLDQARGKIVLFRRFGASNLPLGIDASNWPDNTTFSIGTTLRVQDHYQVSDNDRKWSRILATLNEARDGAPNTLHVNFASGYISGLFGIPDIPGVSNHINPRLSAFLTTNPAGPYGTVLMDFADAAKAALVYNTNSPGPHDPHPQP